MHLEQIKEIIAADKHRRRPGPSLKERRRYNDTTEDEDAENNDDMLIEYNLLTKCE